MIRIDSERNEIAIEGTRKEVIIELVFMLEELEEHLGNIWVDAFDEFLRRKGIKYDVKS